MNLKFLTCATIIAGVAYAPVLFAQQQTTAEKVDAAAEQAATDVKQAAESAETKAQAIETKLEGEINKPAEPVAASTPPAADVPATSAIAPPPEDPLIQQYRLRKDKNFKAIEFELAKELALHRSSVALAEEEDRLYAAALQNLSTALGNISEPQKEETYFEYQEDPDTGEFVVVLVKDSYVKAERGDVCQVGTQVHLRTSIQSEFSAKLATLTPPAPAAPATDAVATTATPPAEDSAAAVSLPKPPTNFTEIECYNEERPTYSQRLVN